MEELKGGFRILLRSCFVVLLNLFIKGSWLTVVIIFGSFHSDLLGLMYIAFYFSPVIENEHHHNC